MRLFLTLSVVTFRPIVPCPTLSKAVVIRLEEFSHGPRPDGVHCAGLEVDEDGPGDVLAALTALVVHLDPFRLYVILVGVGHPLSVKPMLVSDDLPELAADLRLFCSKHCT